MTVTRRDFVLASGAMTAAASLPAAAANLGSDVQPHTVIWDSRVNGLEAALPSSTQRIDLAALDDHGWFRLGAMLGAGTTVQGYTDWSSFVVLRDALREQGLRLHAREERIDYHQGRSLFVWQMA